MAIPRPLYILLCIVYRVWQESDVLPSPLHCELPEELRSVLSRFSKHRPYNKEGCINHRGWLGVKTPLTGRRVETKERLNSLSFQTAFTLFSKPHKAICLTIRSPDFSLAYAVSLSHALMVPEEDSLTKCNTEPCFLPSLTTHSSPRLGHIHSRCCYLVWIIHFLVFSNLSFLFILDCSLSVDKATSGYSLLVIIYR